MKEVVILGGLNRFPLELNAPNKTCPHFFAWPNTCAVTQGRYQRVKERGANVVWETKLEPLPVSPESIVRSKGCGNGLDVLVMPIDW